MTDTWISFIYRLMKYLAKNLLNISYWENRMEEQFSFSFSSATHLSNIVATVYFEFLQHCSNFVPIMLPCNQASLQIVSCNIAHKFQSSTIPLQKKNAWRVCFQQKHFCKRDPYILRLVSGDTYLLLWPRMCALTKYFSNKNHFWKLFKHDQWSGFTQVHFEISDS